MEPAAGGFVVLGIVMLLFPVTGAVAGLLGFLALRDGVDWRLWRLALGVAVMPYVFALLISGSHVVEVITEVFESRPALLSPVVVGLLLLGGLARAASNPAAREE
jgi:hypothetical protein